MYINFTYCYSLLFNLLSDYYYFYALIILSSSTINVRMKYPIAFLVIFFYTSVLLGQHLDARIQQLELDQSAYQSKILELDSILEVLRLEKIRSDMQNIGLPKQSPDVKHELVGHGAIFI